MNLTQNHKIALAIAKSIHNVLFSGAEKLTIKDKTFPVRLYAGGLCKGLVFGEHLFITQNPDKTSKFAEMARKGTKISWVIHQPTNKYLGRVQDGELIPS